MYPILITLHVFVALGMIALILMQQGKGADIGSAFGAGASATLFGARGSANFLTRTTAILATVFFLNSILLAYLVAAEHKPASLMDRVAVPAVKPSSDLPELPGVSVPTDAVQPQTASVAAQPVQQPVSTPQPASGAVPGTSVQVPDRAIPKVEEARTDASMPAVVPQPAASLPELGAPVAVPTPETAAPAADLAQPTTAAVEPAVVPGARPDGATSLEAGAAAVQPASVPAAP